MTTFASTMLFVTSLFSEVRCHKCGRLLLRWENRGQANIEVKCPRCGSIDVIQLSTN